MSQTEPLMTAEAPEGLAPPPSVCGEGAPEALPQLSDETLRLWTAFSPLPAELRRWALAVGAVERTVAGAAYASAGEVAVVVSGCLATGAGGAALAADILGPGEVMATGSPRVVAGQWITAGEVYRVGLEDWMQRAGTDGLVHLLEAADRRRAALERRLVCATGHLATARVADLLLSIQRAAPGAGILMSQARLGAMLGLRRTTVNGSCRALEQAGAFRTSRGKIRIVDLAHLTRAACGCRGAE